MNTINRTLPLGDESRRQGHRAMKFNFPPESKPLEGYTIKRAIEKGGFGEVYYAVSDAGKEVALKLLKDNLEIELRGVRQCLNLKHPNLITIFDIRQDADGDHWIVMEFVAGRTLFDVIRDTPKGMPVEEVRHWLGSVASGLDFLHERGIVHRDLKPANIFEEDGIVKIGDVGLSKFISESQRGAQTQSVGTVYYMAPEVSRGQYGRELDVYSLGVMLFEMLTGQLPFQGDTPGEILMKHLAERPDLSLLPERYRPVLAKALEKDPLLRTPSAGALLADFEAALSGKTVSPPPEQQATPQEKLREEVKRAASNQDRHHTQTRSAETVQRAHSEKDWREFAQKNWPLLLISGFVLMILMPRMIGGLVGPLISVGGFALAVGLVGLLGYKVYSYIAEEEHKKKLRREAERDKQRQKPASPIFSESTNRKHRFGKTHTMRQHLTPDTVRQIPLNVRMMELLTSMSLATIFTILVTMVLFYATDSINSLQVAATYGLSALFASWAILAESKLLEGRKIDGTIRRVRMLVLGAFVGAGVYWINSLALFPLAAANHFSASNDLPGLKIENLGWLNGSSLLTSFVIFFSLIFALRRWWWHVDAFRSSRVRVWSLLGTFLLAMIVPLFVSFPYEWSVLWATGISAIVQLSAGWTSPKERAELVAGGMNSYGQVAGGAK